MYCSDCIRGFSQIWPTASNPIRGGGAGTGGVGDIRATAANLPDNPDVTKSKSAHVSSSTQRREAQMQSLAKC